MATKLTRYSWLPGGLAAALAIVLGRLMSSASFAPLELSVYDRVMRSQRARPADDVVVIAIDEASRAKLGKWPWPADVHASLLDRLSSHGARVVVFSVPLDTSRSSSERERLRAKADDMLSYDLKNAVKEVVGTCLSMGVNVDGKRPREVLAAIDARTYDAVLAS